MKKKTAVEIAVGQWNLWKYSGWGAFYVASKDLAGQKNSESI